jgi:cystathionine beta-lyase
MAALKDGPKRNEDGRFFYGRRGAPTQWALAEALTELEPGAAGTMLYPSGVCRDCRLAHGGTAPR